MAKFTPPDSNGERMLQGQVVLATFPNENGLEAVSGTAWVQTGESGTPLIGVPGSWVHLRHALIGRARARTSISPANWLTDDRPA